MSYNAFAEDEYMIPKRITSEPEMPCEVKIEDIIKVLDTDYKESGSADKAIKKLQQLLDGLSER